MDHADSIQDLIRSCAVGAVERALAFVDLPEPLRAAYGLEAIPPRWRQALQGEWPPRSGPVWRVGDLVPIAVRLAALAAGQDHG